MSGRPPAWPKGAFSDALAEGIYQLAGKLYKATGKHLLKSVTLDREDLLTHGIDGDCEIATAVGTVKVVGRVPSAFEGECPRCHRVDRIPMGSAVCQWCTDEQVPF